MKILAILAQQGDHSIYAWPIFQCHHIEKHLICAGAVNGSCLDNSSKSLNFSYESLNIPESIVSSLEESVSDVISRMIDDLNPTVVFTHNPGNNPHPDHAALFDIVRNHPKVENLIVSDIVWDNGSIKRKKTKHCRMMLCNSVKDDEVDPSSLYFVKTTIRHRKDVLEVLSSLLLGENLSCAEIGVYKGITTKHLANCPHIDQVYAIDPWEDRKDYSDNKKLLGDISRSNSHGKAIKSSSWEALYDHVSADLQQYSNVQIVRQTSKQAVSHIPDNLDFVFIDGDHSYESVKEDLELWVPKVRSGGIVAGHDYTWSCDSGGKKGLVKAVLEYFEDNKTLFEQPLEPRRNHVINRAIDRVWWQLKV